MFKENVKIFFSETWLNNNVIDPNFCPLEYDTIRNDRLSRRGVAVIKTFLNYLRLKLTLFPLMVLYLYVLI